MAILSQIWGSIQGYLFPYLEDELGPLTEKEKQFVSILEIIRIEQFVRAPFRKAGRRQKERIALARAFVGKAVYNLATTRTLIEALKSCPHFRRICGFETVLKIPHESTFSRAFDEFSRGELPHQVHAALIEKHQSEQLKGHISRDSTAIKGNEKPCSKRTKDKNTQPKRKRGRPQKGETPLAKEPTRLERQLNMPLQEMLADLPKTCDRGTKKNSKGYKVSWNGYKLHLDCVDGQIPVSCIVTSASVHDSQVAIPLSAISAQRVTCLYELMDSAYDAEPIKKQIGSLGHVPIIDPNPRRGEKREMDPVTKERYKERTSVERVFGRLKEEFNANHVKVRGHAKVTAHLMFGVLALTADQLLRLVM
jgi:IS5 family transposase